MKVTSLGVDTGCADVGLSYLKLRNWMRIRGNDSLPVQRLWLTLQWIVEGSCTLCSCTFFSTFPIYQLWQSECVIEHISFLIC
jgi:hypothetical protein